VLSWQWLLTKFVCWADSGLLYISKLRPYITTWHRIPLATTVRNIALLHNKLRGALGVDHVMILFGWQYFMQIILLKMSHRNLYSFARKDPFTQATPRVVLSALIGNFAKKVACFSWIFSHPIAKNHIKRCSVREHDATWDRLFLPFVSEQLRLI